MCTGYALTSLKRGGRPRVVASVVGGRCPPAYCSTRLPVFYDFYKKLTELSANKLACYFCWLLEHSYQSQ